ncbi:MAG: D-sedoheptulose 7-phosphate isomerase [Bacteroidales bacterium]|nr:D-sedoheptulose 7-phosphate isomerase [Bacteroidales bacterium]
MTTTLETVRAQVAESARVKEALLADETLMGRIAEVADLLAETYRNGGKTLWAGNGGSAADAQHMAAELVNKFCLDRPGLPAIALTTDTSILTAVGNDYGFDRVFAKQVEAHGRPGDVFIGISTSGNSRNLVEALSACREKGVRTVALVGGSACAMDNYDYVIHVPSTETPRIQESQTLIGHILCFVVESRLFQSHFKTDSQ